MAIKKIAELTEANSIGTNDMLVIEQGGEAKKLSGQTLVTDLMAIVEGHGSVVSITLVDGALVFNMSDGETINVGSVKGDKGDKGDTSVVTSVTLVSGDHSAGSSDTYRVAFDNGTTFDFAVYNGLNGSSAVSTVNGIAPDSNGNVDLGSIGGHVTTVSADYTITSEDDAGTVIVNSSDAVSIYCPADSGIAIGAVITVLNIGTGTVTISNGTGATLSYNMFADNYGIGYTVTKAERYSPVKVEKIDDALWVVANHAYCSGARAARKLASWTVGNASTPVYFSSGYPRATTGVVKTVNDTAPDSSGNVAVTAGINMDLLWSNSNPAASFSEQTITVATGYKFYIVMATTTFDSYANDSIVLIPPYSGQLKSRHHGDGSASIFGYRNVFTDDGSIRFSDGYAFTSGNSPATANTIMVPTAIYGVK